MTIWLKEVIDEHPNGVPVRIRGSAMEPTLDDGHAVWFDRDFKPTIDAIVLVRQFETGRYLVCRYRGASLAYDNPEFPTSKLTAGDRVIGVAVACTAPASRAPAALLARLRA